MLRAPLTLLASPLRLTEWGRQRVRFEEQEDLTFFRGDWGFEVASEGELEQVRPWLDQLLAEKQKIELIFASPSVEKGIQRLQERFPSLVRWKPLPLLTANGLSGFFTAPRLILCRYDFFPALMFLCGLKRVHSGLVWATFKNRRQRLRFPWWRAWYRFFYGVFDWIIPATDLDQKLFEEIHPRVLKARDFRVGQILKRLEQSDDTLQRLFPHWDEFRQILERTPKHRRLLLGSAWEADLALLDNPELRLAIERQELLVMVVPHKNGDWARDQLRAQGLPVKLVRPNLALPTPGPGVWVLDLKGVLCELYRQAGKVYVGGGLGYSVHSVLEPFVAGAYCWCGPQVRRSTEVELVQSVNPHALKVGGDAAAIGKSIAQSLDDAHGPDGREQWAENQRRLAREALSEVRGLR